MIPPVRLDVDVAVVGSGFAGALTALALQHRGQRVLLVERGRHPRFVIGESSTPLANLLLEELADRYGLPRVRPFSKWGTWQRARPDVPGGLKRGFSFYFHKPGEAFADTAAHERQLLVAASPHDEAADVHWYRPGFDHALVREAEAAGVRYLDQTHLERFDDTGTGVVLGGARGDAPVRITTQFVIDATGPRGFLHQALGLHSDPLRWLPHTQGLYTHFEQVARWGHASDERPPYPPDDAALHHVFPGGWIWILRFNNGLTSAGAAVTDAVAARLGLGTVPHADAWDRLMASLPSVHAQFQGARIARPWVHAPHLAFRSREVCGRRWALLPSAAGVIDPLLSTGFPLTLLGIGRLLDVLERTKEGAGREAALDAYAQETRDELDVTEQLVGALYANMTDVPVFKRLGLLYFAAASYSEAARRLGRPDLAPGFLLHRHPRFGSELRTCAALAAGHPLQPADRDALLARIDRAIEPFDVAGLGDRSRHDWHPVRAEDIVSSAGKLEATSAEIYTLLERCGFAVHQASTSSDAGPTRNSA
ncbi:MAG: FAD-dependent oxidoreductase [Acidobacteriota bacterium]